MKSLRTLVSSCAKSFSDNQSLLTLCLPSSQVQFFRLKIKLCILEFGKSNAISWLYYKTLDKLYGLEQIMQILKTFLRKFSLTRPIVCKMMRMNKSSYLWASRRQ